MLFDRAVHHILTATAETVATSPDRLAVVFDELANDYRDNLDFRHQVDEAARVALRLALECVGDGVTPLPMTDRVH